MSSMIFGVTLGVVYCLTLAWPLNVPLMALAYKVRIGSQPIPIGAGEFWGRSALAALALAVLSLLPLVANLMFPGSALIVLLIYFFFYFPLASYLTFWIYALEEPIEGLSVFSLYILLPGFPLFFLLWKTEWWTKLIN